MIKKMEWKWEVLDEFTKRAKVIGGWLVVHGSHTNKGAISDAMSFVPDSDHQWTIIVPKVDVQQEANILAADFKSK